MGLVRKVSEITVEALADYLRLSDPARSDTELLATLLTAAKEYVRSYTGQEDLDKYATFVPVVYILVQDMYDNRTMYVDGYKTATNSVVESILGMHSINLLPSE